MNGGKERRDERRHHPLGNKPWKKELHHQDEPWIRSLEGCFNGGKERGRERVTCVELLNKIGVVEKNTGLILVIYLGLVRIGLVG